MSETPLRTSDGYDVLPNRYIQDGRDLYKVSTVYDTYVTLILCMASAELPARTTVREISLARVRAMSEPTDAIVDKYHAKLDGKS